MQNKVRTAIIGCGKVTRWHVTALKRARNSECVAAYSRSLEKATQFSKEHGLQPFNNITSMIKNAGVQSVVICTPHPYHLDAVLEAASAGAHCIVEKPLAASLADCDAMIEACNKAGVKLGMISQRRFLQPVQRIKKAIDAGKIGTPVLGTVNVLGWRDRAYYDSDSWRGSWDTEGGGVMVNQASHQLDLLLWLMGDIEEVYGTWENFNHSYVEVEDTALAIIKFRNGGLGNVIVSNSMKPGIYGKVQIHGANAASVGVQVDGGSMPLPGQPAMPFVPVNDLWTIPGEEHLLQQWVEEDNKLYAEESSVEYPFLLQHEDFLDAIIRNRPPLVDAVAGRKTVELFSAIYRSARDNKPISFPLLAETGRNDFDGRKVSPK